MAPVNEINQLKEDLNVIDESSEVQVYFQLPPATTTFDTETVCSDMSQFSRQSKRVLKSKKLQQITSDGDVWYERIMKSKKTGKTKSCFVSSNTGVHVLDEPPSGASRVVYADEYMNMSTHEKDEYDIGSISICSESPYLNPSTNSLYGDRTCSSNNHNIGKQIKFSPQMRRNTFNSFQKHIVYPLDTESVISEVSQTSMQSKRGRRSFMRSKRQRKVRKDKNIMLEHQLDIGL